MCLQFPRLNEITLQWPFTALIATELLSFHNSIKSPGKENVNLEDFERFRIAISAVSYAKRRAVIPSDLDSRAIN